MDYKPEADDNITRKRQFDEPEESETKRTRADPEPSVAAEETTAPAASSLNDTADNADKETKPESGDGVDTTTANGEKETSKEQRVDSAGEAPNDTTSGTAELTQKPASGFSSSSSNGTVDPAINVSWYYVDASNSQSGPHNLEAMRSVYKSGVLTEETLVWNETFDSWKPLRESPSFLDFLNSDLPVPPAPVASVPQVSTASSGVEIMEVPNQYVGFLIGKGGAKISELQARSGARIQTQKDSEIAPGALVRKVTIAGTPEQIAFGRQVVLEAIREAEARHSQQGNFAARQPIAPGMAPRIINIPSTAVGLIIGKAGAKINELQAASGAKIQVQRDSEATPGAPERPVTVYGTPEQIELAERLIWNTINEGTHNKGGAASYGHQSGASQWNQQSQMQAWPQNWGAWGQPQWPAHDPQYQMQQWQAWQQQQQYQQWDPSAYWNQSAQGAATAQSGQQSQLGDNAAPGSQ